MFKNSAKSYPVFWIIVQLQCTKKGRHFSDPNRWKDKKKKRLSIRHKFLSLLSSLWESDQLHKVKYEDANHRIEEPLNSAGAEYVCAITGNVAKQSIQVRICLIFEGQFVPHNNVQKKKGKNCLKLYIFSITHQNPHTVYNNEYILMHAP